MDYSDLLNQKRIQETRHRNSADIFASATSGGGAASSMKTSSSDGFLSQSVPNTFPSATDQSLAAGLSDLTEVVNKIDGTITYISERCEFVNDATTRHP